MYCTVMSPLQPAFELGSNTVRQWQEVFAHVSIFTGHRVLVALALQPRVPTPAIRTHHTPRLYAFFYSIAQTACRRIGYPTKANTSYVFSVW